MWSAQLCADTWSEICAWEPCVDSCTGFPSAWFNVSNVCSSALGAVWVLVSLLLDVAVTSRGERRQRPGMGVQTVGSPSVLCPVSVLSTLTASQFSELQGAGRACRSRNGLLRWPLTSPGTLSER